MPVLLPCEFNPLDQAAFRELDYRVTHHAFDCHRELGRFCDERVCQQDMTARLATAGFQVCRELPVKVTHGEFIKKYVLDLVVSNGAVYELKTVERLSPEHEAQLMNYLYLTGCHHGKLLNFCGPSVTARFVNALITTDEQRRFYFELDAWKPNDSKERHLLETLDQICQDWGVFLETSLYAEALAHFFGGINEVLRAVPLVRNRIRIGTQKLHHLNEQTLFKVTSFTGPTRRLAKDLQSLLALTPAQRMHWINFNRHSVSIATLRK